MGKNISYLLLLYNKNTEKRNLLQLKCKRFLKLMTLLKIKPFQALLRNIPFCSLGEVGGAGAGFFILFPVFGGEMATAKIQSVKGLRKYYSSIDGLDSRNARRTEIVFCNWVWYNFPQYKPINRYLRMNF